MTVSRELGKSYEDARLIIAHLGGGVSIGAHAGGRIIDSTSSRGEGAFSMGPFRRPQRLGAGKTLLFRQI